MSDDRLRCPYCGHPLGSAFTTATDHTYTEIYCSYSLCGAEWDYTGRLTRKPRKVRADVTPLQADIAATQNELHAAQAHYDHLAAHRDEHPLHQTAAAWGRVKRLEQQLRRLQAAS